MTRCKIDRRKMDKGKVFKTGETISRKIEVKKTPKMMIDPIKPQH